MHNSSTPIPTCQSPQVSIIMPVCNSIRFIGEALESLRVQTYREFEVIVVDGESTDGTLDMVREWARSFDHLLRVLPQQGRGLGGGRNTGLDAAQGHFIAFLDSDDRWDPAKLERQVACLVANPSLPWCLGWVQLFLEPGAALRSGFDPTLFQQSRAGYTPGALLARREFFHTVGPFNTDLPLGCDSDWLARALDQQPAPVLLPEALLFKRIHDTNLSAQIDEYRRDMMTMLHQSVQRKKAAARQA